MSMRRRAADQQRARSIRRAVRRAVQQQRTAVARMAAQLAGVVGGRSALFMGNSEIGLEAGGVSNVDARLYRRAAAVSKRMHAVADSPKALS